MNNREQLMTHIIRLVTVIKPMLAQHDPRVVGAVLGELTAIFLAGQHPSLRAEQKRMLREMIDDLVPLVFREMVEEGVAPGCSD